MINNKSVAVVLPAYNAEKTLRRTVEEIPSSVDACILVDDQSRDGTAELARRLGLQVHIHPHNRGLRRKPEDLLQSGSGCRS